MPSFGEKLRREREKRSITLEQISLATKIGTRMLQALEDDHFSQLPGGIFNKGFVRAYARHVGLDEDQTVAEYLQASGDAPPVQPELPAAPSLRITEASSDLPKRQLPWGVFAALLLLAALALSIWSHRQRKHESTPNPPPSTPTAAPQTAEDHAVQSPVAPDAVPSNSNDKNPVASAPMARTADSGALTAPPKSPANTPATGSPTSPSEPTAPSAQGEFVVVIQAREDSWTVIKADDRTVYTGLLSAGDHRVVRGRKEVTVKAGNAGGLDLNFNGKKLDPQGESGQVRTITFGPGGVVANSPSTPTTP